MRSTVRLVPDFIIPSLNRSTYGEHLHWENKRDGSFKISRIHQSSDMWNEQCIEVYKAWSLKKNHWQANDPKRITKAKHRLITALRRNPEIEMLRRESTFYRFRILHPEISDSKLHQDNPDNDVQAITKRKGKMKISEFKEETVNCDVNISENKNPEKKDSTVFYSIETTNNYTNWSYPQSEMYDIQREHSILDEALGNELYPVETKSTVFSDKCCCEKFLDTYLCNQKCIWHGMPP